MKTCAMKHVNKTFPAGSVVGVVFAFTHCFHRHLDLCGMFDRPLCRKVVATYMLMHVESTSLTTCVTQTWPCQ